MSRPAGSARRPNAASTTTAASTRCLRGNSVRRIARGLRAAAVAGDRVPENGEAALGAPGGGAGQAGDLAAVAVDDEAHGQPGHAELGPDFRLGVVVVGEMRDGVGLEPGARVGALAVD